MIYVLDSDFKYNITSKILDFYNIKYKAVEASGQDLINILMEDNFSAIFLTYEYKDILNEYYNKDIKKFFLAVDLITKK